MLAHGSRQRHVSLDIKLVSRVLVPIDGEGSFFRTRYQSGSHILNVFNGDFHNLAPTFFVLFLYYVSLDTKPVSQVLIIVDGELSFLENQI